MNKRFDCKKTSDDLRDVISTVLAFRERRFGGDNWWRHDYSVKENSLFLEGAAR